MLLVSRAGRLVNQAVLNLVAQPVAITGEVERQGELIILRADPVTYCRVSKLLPSARHVSTVRP